MRVLGKYDKIKQEISELLEQGEKMHTHLVKSKEDPSQLAYFIRVYEVWYTKALYIVKQILPERLEDFIQLYKLDKRKDINLSTYTISDALNRIGHYGDLYGPWTAASNFLRQYKILSACLDKFDSKVYDLQLILQADIFDSEIDSAHHLLKMGYLRPAGAICGVVIEKHLSTVCVNRNISVKKKNPSIADYNEALKDIAYGIVEWRKIQRLADIRNLCDHSKEREPMKDEVEELISGTSWLSKTIF